MRGRLLALALLSAGCPSREDFVLVPEVQGPRGTCAGDPEVFGLDYTVRWANGDRADPVTVSVGAHADLVDVQTRDILAGRILVESGPFDGELGRGETAAVGYSAELEDPSSFDCADVCAGELRVRLLYGIDYGMAPSPVADTEVQSDVFSLDCG